MAKVALCRDDLPRSSSFKRSGRSNLMRVEHPGSPKVPNQP
jgi:hypothetical protein